MKKETTRSRLRIHRETLRVLSDARLGRVAGGTMLVGSLDANVLGVDNGNKMEDTLPRSNGWTSIGEINVATC